MKRGMGGPQLTLYKFFNQPKSLFKGHETIDNVDNKSAVSYIVDLLYKLPCV